MTELWKRDAWDLADAIRRGEVTSRAAVEESLTRIASHDGALNAICHLDVTVRSLARTRSIVRSAGGMTLGLSPACPSA